jgi:bifunctional UDP-N-acetylglucosamine pyrophosphorylase/glucosamine-1-phosphate N-acetyltransferase
MLGHVLAANRALDPEHLVVVVGHAREQVAAHVEQVDPGAVTVVQEPQNGTGHAVQVALAALPELSGTVVVVLGDAPLLQTETLRELVTAHDDPTGYGRVVRDSTGAVTAIVEHKDADEAVRAVHEINSGVFAFDAAQLREAIGRLTTDNAQGELYLTDVLGLHHAAGLVVRAHVAATADETMGVNDRVQLSQARRLLNDRLLEQHMRSGVTVVDPLTTWVDVDVRVGSDVTLHPGTQLLGRSAIGAGAVVGPDTTLRDTTVGARASVVRSHCDGAVVGDEATVGPFSYLRPGAVLGRGSKVGAYVEIKASEIGAGSKVPHLSYVGDAVVGERSNIGAATVVVNYDGRHKHRTTIGDDVRIGSDTMLVAPVHVGDGAYTAAGSVITDDVPAGSLGVGRARQRNIEGWVARKRGSSEHGEQS